MSFDELLERLPGALRAEAAEGVEATILFRADRMRHVVISGGIATVHDGEITPYTVAISMSDDDLVGLLTGRVNPMTAFMTGRLKIDGDLGFAQRVARLFSARRLID